MKKVLSIVAALLLCVRNTGTDCIIQKCNRQDSKASE